MADETYIKTEQDPERSNAASPVKDYFPAMVHKTDPTSDTNGIAESSDKKRKLDDTTQGTSPAGSKKKAKAKGLKAKTEIGEKQQRVYNQSLATAVTAHQPLPNTVLSAVEILTYFPHHTQWPEIHFRFYRAGWRSSTMAAVALHARGTLTKQEYNKRDGTLRHQITAAGREKFGKDFKGPTSDQYINHVDLQPVKLDSYTKDKGFPNGILEYYDVTDTAPHRSAKIAKVISSAPALTLRDVDNGVLVHPTGNDAGVLTQVIQHAATLSPPFCDKEGKQLTTKDIPRIVKEKDLRLPAIARTEKWDQAGLATAQAIPKPTQ